MKLDETLLWNERLWAFVAEIRANPDDPAPRLVFADWLTDYGEEDFAQDLRDECDPGSSWQAGLWPESRSVLGVPPFPRQPRDEHDWRLVRVRRPRVQITYRVDQGDATSIKEVPFVIGVLANLSGPNRHDSAPLVDRRFQDIDRDNFNAVLAQVAPHLSLQVANRVSDQGDTVPVELVFEKFDDFEPEQIASRIPCMRELLDARSNVKQLEDWAATNPELVHLLQQVLEDEELRTRTLEELDERYRTGPTPEELEALRPRPRIDPDHPIASFSHITFRHPEDIAREQRERMVPIRHFLLHCPAGDQANGPPNVRDVLQEWAHDLDSRLSRQLVEIMHHPEFRALESTWRGLQFLVLQTETGESLRLEVLDASKEELLEAASALESWTLFRKGFDARHRTEGEIPFGLLVGDYYFGRSDEDLELLESLAALAARNYSPIVLGTSPKMFGVESLSELADIPNLTARFEGEHYLRWKEFRNSVPSCYVVLTLPRVRARRPFGAESNHLEAFEFEELRHSRASDPYLWMNSSWDFAVRVADSYSKSGWFARMRGLGFPEWSDRPAEVALGLERLSRELIQLGMSPLVRVGDLRDPFLPMANSCHTPGNDSSAGSPDEANRAVDIGFLLCATRFLHYFDPQYFENNESLVSDTPWGPDDWARFFQRWIDDYCGSGAEKLDSFEQAKRPLLEAEVEASPSQFQSNSCVLRVGLRPHYQLEEPLPMIRFVVELPRQREEESASP